MELLQQFYNYQTYFAFNKQVDGKLVEEPHYDRLSPTFVPEIEIDQNVHQNQEIQQPMELMEDHVYVNESMEPDAIVTLSRVVSIDTNNKAGIQQKYFFGDTFGVLPCKKCNRSLETLEASIIFGDEQDIGDKFVSSTHSITPSHVDIGEDKDSFKIKINSQNDNKEEESAKGLYSPDVQDTLTKDQIVEIFCSNE